MRFFIVYFTVALSILGKSSVHAEDISLTVYNNNLAVVKLVDEMTFEKGLQTKSITGVADQIDPTSVRFTAEKGSITIIEQNYHYDLVSSQKVLQKYIDRDIAIRLEEGDFIEGTLQAVSGDVVIKGSDGTLTIVQGDAIERFEFPELPGGLITRPTLVWQVYSKNDVTTPAEISYMTQGMSWHAEYTAVVNDEENAMELSSWVSIDNNSGATYEDAILKVVAGEVHRVTPPAPAYRPRMLKAEVMADNAGAGFEERGLFEYHLYELKGQTTVRNAEIKQISLFEPSATKAEKLFTYDASRNAKKVAVKMVFTNSEKDGIGMPLPAGKVRMYKRDTDGALEFVGEDSIGHTPKNEKVRLTLGNAFDLVGERRVVDTAKISSRIREETVEIKLRNRKDEPVTITAVEHLWGDWNIRKKSLDFVKKDADTIEFAVHVPSDGEAVVTYTVRYR